MTNAARTLQHTPPLRLIMSQEHERRDTPTIEAPPPSGTDASPPTQPPGAGDAAATQHGQTLLPPAAGTPTLNADGLVDQPSNMPELLYNQLMRVHQGQVKRDDDLLNPDGKFAALVRSLVDSGADKVAAKLEPRFLGIERELASAVREAGEAMRIARDALNRVEALEKALLQSKGTQPTT